VSPERESFVIEAAASSIMLSCENCFCV
jgi:hypothetical protein